MTPHISPFIVVRPKHVADRLNCCNDNSTMHH